MAELGEPLKRVLQDRLLEVAEYQRPYAWEQKQLLDLWTDIDLLGDHLHYTGTLVLQDTGATRSTRSGEVLPVYEVVDGQQRLTTCMILLDCLRHRLLSLPAGDTEAEEAASDLHRLLFVNVEGVGRPRLQLAGGLRNVFEETVLGRQAAEGAHLTLGAQRLLDAREFFDERLDELTAGASTAEALHRLLGLRKRTSYQLKFLVYSVARADEVGVLFETVNGRGKSLSELERVKNYLLYLSRQLGATQRDDVARRINESWAAIFTSLARVGLRDDALLRAHWLVTQDANTRNWHGADSVKSKFPRSEFVADSSRLASTGRSSDDSDEHNDRLYLALVDYVDSLRKSARVLADVYDYNSTYPAFPDLGARVGQKTAALRRSGSVAPFHTLILATRLRHPDDGELYLRVIDFCERFSARVWAIRGLRSNAGESSLRWAARDLFVGDPATKVLDRLERRLWELAPDDGVRASFAASVQWYQRATAHKFVLYEYELDKQRGASDLPQFGEMSARGSKTTEHVLPQHPAPGSAWWDDFTPEQHSALVHGIGNLVLTRDNSRYGRRPYRDGDDGLEAGKRGREGQQEPWCYFSESNLRREREIALLYPEWTPASIEHRAAQIAVWALRRWPASQPLSASTDPTTDEDDDRLVEEEELEPSLEAAELAV